MSEIETLAKGLTAQCAHIADYYQWVWESQKSIGSNLLRHGYRQWAEGRAVTVAFGMPANNLYAIERGDFGAGVG